MTRAIESKRLRVLQLFTARFTVATAVTGVTDAENFAATTMDETLLVLVAACIIFFFFTNILLDAVEKKRSVTSLRY